MTRAKFKNNRCARRRDGRRQFAGSRTNEKAEHIAKSTNEKRGLSKAWFKWYKK